MKTKAYFKNTVKSFLIIFNSKHFALIAKFSVLVPVAPVLLHLTKEVTKEVSSISNDVPYSV